MWSVEATRRASWRSSIEQQLPNDRSSPPAASYSCMDRPMTSCPWSASNAAATEESTPPDIATTIRIGNDRLSRTRLPTRGARLLREPAQLLDQSRQHRDDAIDVGVGREHSEAEAQRVLRAMSREPHRPQDVRRLERARRTRGTGRHRDALEVERDQQAFGLHPVETDVRRVRY